MRASVEEAWLESNQHHLMAALAEVRAALERRVLQTEDTKMESTCLQPIDLDQGSSKEGLADAQMDERPPALEVLSGMFGLSPFERGILLLSAGVELDSSFASLCSRVQGDPERNYPTFGLALSTLDGSHWNALTPKAPLRRWKLIEIDNTGTLTQSPFRIDERVLHYLTGINQIDERLAGLMETVIVDGGLVPSHANIVQGIKAVLSGSMTRPPAIQLYGSDTYSQQAIAATACAELGLNLQTITASALPTIPSELDLLERLWEREAALSCSALLLDCSDLDGTDAVREKVVSRFIEHTGSITIISSQNRKRMQKRLMVTFDVGKPNADEQRSVWDGVLSTSGRELNGQARLLVSHFDMAPRSIQAACADALIQTRDNGQNDQTSGDIGKALWDACRAQARPRMHDLAQRIEPGSDWDDLVLPEAQIRILRQIAAQVRHRAMVYEDWGFASKGQRGLGISALFSGGSGTGKTMAAEVLAGDLDLDLYRIDLSQVVSKYIGETEKNLRRVFDAAECGGSVLLFDEADALFGRRSEVKDSHDRYANIEISYLLQRMESYRGLAILTTNMKEALDKAFLRRIRFIVQFPFPEIDARAEIWRRVFPEKVPKDGLDYAKLARLNVTGGNIRNIALGAAFLAADEEQPVRMTYLLQAARAECEKIQKSPTDSEIGGWV